MESKSQKGQLRIGLKFCMGTVWHYELGGAMLRWQLHVSLKKI